MTDTLPSPSSQTPPEDVATNAEPVVIEDPHRYFKMMAIRSWNPDMTKEELEKEYEHQEWVRLLDAKQSLVSPLYRARAEKLGMEEYLRTYRTGRVR